MTINDVLEYFGKKSEVTRAVGVKRSNFSNWERLGIPIHHQYTLEELTQGKLKADIKHTFHHFTPSN